VVGHDDHAVGARDLLRRERDRREVDGLIPKPRDVRIVIRDHRAPPLQQADHVESGALADVVDVLLVRHADDQHLAAPRGAPLLVEAIHDAPHPVLGHLGVDLARELDESRPVVERPHLPREVVRVEGDAMPPDAGPRRKLHETERLRRRGLDHLPHVDAQLVAHDRHLVDEPDVHAAERVLEDLHELGRFRR